jgi:hypothetical protein
MFIKNSFRRDSLTMANMTDIMIDIEENASPLLSKHKNIFGILMIKKILYIFCSFIFLSGLFSQEYYYYFYHPDIDYGSELYFNPLTVVINGTFDILRNGGHEKDIFAQEYKAGMENVWENISHPIKHINIFGWKRFISQEVFPLSLKKEKAQYIPNYIHHIFGEGMLYAKMGEWYDYHGIKYPYLVSLVTTAFFQYLNESVENESFNKTNVDPIADLLIFNPLGYLLFSFNNIKRFFSDKIYLNDWSLQPLYNPYSHQIENAGEQFILRYKLPFANNYSTFFYWGICGIFGISYHYNKIHNFSFGIGNIVNKIRENIITNSRIMTPDTDGAIGIFYDKNNSLMTSVIITGPRFYNARINIYPGFVKLGCFIPGMYLAFGEWDKFIIGITVAKIPFGLFAR